MGNAGRVLAIIGAVVGILGVVLGLAIPALFCWYHFGMDFGMYSGDIYVTGLGGVVSDPSGADFDAAMLVMIGGILVFVGAALCVVCAATSMKVFGIIGGILMIVGPLFLIIDLGAGVSEFSEFLNDNWIDPLNSYYGGGYNIFAGSFDYMGYSLNWGIWPLGYAIPFIGGALGIAGGAAT